MSDQRFSSPDDDIPLPRLSWDLGTAYDLFISLHVLHNHDEFGLRASWAAGVRSRLSAEDRKTLEDADKLFEAPLYWVYTLPSPKDGANALWALRQLPAGQRLLALALKPDSNPVCMQLLQNVAEKQSWDNRDLERFQGDECKEYCYKKKLRAEDLIHILNTWAHPAEFGERYLAALQSYNQSFFAEEEKRILPALRDGLEQAQELAHQVSLVQLLEQLSQGVKDTNLTSYEEVIFVPSYWGTPFIFYGAFNQTHVLLTFGARPADASLVPGDLIPDALLQSLKAMADSTRLRILRYLAQEPLTPAELARRLRLRAPTVTHHLNALRLAGLVHLTLGEKEDERQYAARKEAIDSLHAQLRAFLENDLDDVE